MLLKKRVSQKAITKIMDVSRTAFYSLSHKIFCNRREIFFLNILEKGLWRLVTTSLPLDLHKLSQHNTPVSTSLSLPNEKIMCHINTNQHLTYFDKLWVMTTTPEHQKEPWRAVQLETMVVLTM